MLTSPNDVAKLGEGLTRPSVLLLVLLYGLWDPRSVWMPRMLPRLRALVLPFLRWLLLRPISVLPGVSELIELRSIDDVG